jgi:hypothetical protein
VGRSTSYGYGCFTLSNDSGFITADAIPTGLVFIAGTQIITGQKTFSEDIIVGTAFKCTLRYLQTL